MEQVAPDYIFGPNKRLIRVDSGDMDLKVLFKMFWAASKCAFCGEYSTKMKCCSGCMIVPYCSKRCQAKDWKSSHRAICSRKFSELYAILRRRVL